jgi:hypothetical protein
MRDFAGLDAVHQRYEFWPLEIEPTPTCSTNCAPATPRAAQKSSRTRRWFFKSGFCAARDTRQSATGTFAEAGTERRLKVSRRLLHASSHVEPGLLGHCSRDIFAIDATRPATMFGR